MILPSPKFEAEGRVISSFVFQHLLSATLFSRKVHFIEKENMGEPFGEFFTEIRSYASASLMSSAAAIEANINELYISHSSALRKSIFNFEKKFWGRYGIESKSVLKKYTKALDFLQIKFDIQKLEEYEDANLLIALRNELIHFKPNWDFLPEDQKPELAKLPNKFKLSHFADAGSDLISMKCMSYSCSKWGVESAIKFIDKFSEVSGLQNKIERFKIKFKLEE